MATSVIKESIKHVGDVWEDSFFNIILWAPIYDAVIEGMEPKIRLNLLAYPSSDPLLAGWPLLN